ncbi:MAG: hypothetical protein FJY95_09565 [Candidatus Handelsmanbacteria bacterium]|nr:hypothetical protein [Candidatus Handelsmanbacteria bacterium]
MVRDTGQPFGDGQGLAQLLLGGGVVRVGQFDGAGVGLVGVDMAVGQLLGGQFAVAPGVDRDRAEVRDLGEERVELAVLRLAAAVVHQAEAIHDRQLVLEHELFEQLGADPDALLRLPEAHHLLHPRRAAPRGQQVGAGQPAGAPDELRATVAGKHPLPLVQLPLLQGVVAQEGHHPMHELGVIVQVQQELFETAQVDELAG